MPSKFDRALDQGFVEQLAVEATRSGWWADVLADPRLFIALRGRYLNIYWRGQSLFYVEAGKPGFRVTTHEKFLVDPALASQVALVDGAFDVGHLIVNGFIGRYEGIATLDKMKKAAGLYARDEKIGCHEIAVRNPTVVDREVAFPGKILSSGNSVEKQTPQVDLAVFEPCGDDVRLTFWEAKHYNNGDLRTKDGTAPVCRQVAIYRDCLLGHYDAILESYTNVAKNLVEIGRMGWARSLSPLIVDVATGARRLTLGAKPKVGLIVFGFDAAQRDDTGWKAHLNKLKADIPDIVAVGDATTVRV